MPSQALELWETDRHAEIWLARTLAVQPQTGPTAQAAANILLASYVRVTVAEFQAFCATMYREAVAAIGRELRASVSAEMHDLVVSQLTSQTVVGIPHTREPPPRL